MRKAFYDINHSTSYSGNVAKFQRLMRSKMSRYNVKHWLEAQDTYNLHKPVVRKYPRRSYNVQNVDDLWEVDLCDMRSLKSKNDGFCYILVCIDVLSKYAWAELLRDKTSASVAVGFSRILARSKNRFPIQLQSDKGKEFIGDAFQRTLKSKRLIFA